jgi:nitrate/nitrite transporter NarK
MQKMVGLVIGIIGLGIFGVNMARLLSGRTVYVSTYRAVAVYVPILAVLGIGIAFAMFLRWRKARRGANAP